MSKEFDDLLEMAQAKRRELEREQERLVAQANELNDQIKLLSSIGAIIDDYGKVKDENEGLRKRLEEKDRKISDLEIKITERDKLASEIAKAASDEARFKVLRNYVNHSKRKRPDKRAHAKEAALDMVLANKMTLTEDLAATIESLDDDLSEPKVVNVQGNYNDIHDNGTVNQK